MNLTLSENIRSFRKQRKLTQEQLAEVLGVTTGAVYKWESGMSVPELELIVEMADFFDTSVDNLLGYKMKDNRLETTVSRIETYLRNGSMEALAESEKVLKKYPHSFTVVSSCAMAYLIFGSQLHDNGKLQRSLELFEQSLMLISQNEDPRVSEYTIYGLMGQAYFVMGEREKGLDLLKKHNIGGMFDDLIGSSLAIYLRKNDEAESYLSDLFLGSILKLMNAVIGYSYIYSSRGEYARQIEILLWGKNVLDGVSDTNKPNYFNKIYAYLFTLLADAQINTGDRGSAHESLETALQHVRKFDGSPDYSVGALRFLNKSENVTLYDALGDSAMSSNEAIISTLGNKVLADMWEEVKKNG